MINFDVTKVSESAHDLDYSGNLARLLLISRIDSMVRTFNSKENDFSPILCVRSLVVTAFHTIENLPTRFRDNKKIEIT